MDPILIAAMQARPVYFWARAGEFPNNFKGWLLLKLHGMPIYRQQEGKGQMHKNEITFKKTRDLLHKGGNAVFIAPEGRCKIQKRLHPFKTGGARLAFQMMEENNWSVDVKIQPSGVNYTYHDVFRSEVYIHLGATISVLSYQSLYQQDKSKAIQQLTEDMSVALRKQMIYVEAEDELLVEQLLPLIRSDYKRGALPVYSQNDALFKREQNLANWVHQLSSEAKDSLKQQLAAYYQVLKHNKVHDFAVAQKNKRSFVWLLIGFPVWLLGSIAGYLPHTVAQKLKNKFVPYREFSVSFAFTAAFFMWILWSLLWIIPLLFVIGFWAFLVPILMAFLQMYAYHYQDYWNEWNNSRMFNQLVNKKDLVDMRTAIVDALNY